MHHVFHLDPVQRFADIYLALTTNEEDWRDRPELLRFAALAAVQCTDEPTLVATHIRATAATLRATAHWYDDLASPLRYVIAAMLVQSGISAEAFAETLAKDRLTLRAADIRSSGLHEVMAITILRLRNDGRKVDAQQVVAMRQLYEHLRSRHWWFTGSEDLPICAALGDVSRPPDLLAADIEQHYVVLRGQRFVRGSHLLAASALLCLAELPPDQATGRLAALSRAFTSIGQQPWYEDYDALAVLCLLDHPPERVAQVFTTTLERLRRLSPRLYGQTNHSLAADLTFLDLVHRERDGTRVGDAVSIQHMRVRLRRFATAALVLTTSAQSLTNGEVVDGPGPGTPQIWTGVKGLPIPGPGEL